MITTRSLLPESLTAAWIESYLQRLAKRRFSRFSLRAFFGCKRLVPCVGRRVQPLRASRIDCRAAASEPRWQTTRVVPGGFFFSAVASLRYWGTLPPVAGVTLASGAG